jgi:hypothetical protein
MLVVIRLDGRSQMAKMADYRGYLDIPEQTQSLVHTDPKRTNPHRGYEHVHESHRNHHRDGCEASNCSDC